MKKFFVATMSNADLSAEEIAKNEIAILPIKYLDGKIYKEESITPSPFYRRFFEKLRSGEKIRFKKPTKADYDEFFDQLVTSGKTNIIYVATSSKLSTDYLFAKKSASETMIKFPKSNILVFDSLSIGMQKGSLALWACSMRANHSFEETFFLLKERALQECLFAIVYDGEYVYANSEIRGAMGGGSFIGVKPILSVDGEGELRVFKKCKGEKSAINNVLKYAQTTSADKSTFYVYSADSSTAESLTRRLIQEKFPDSEVRFSSAGMTNSMLYAPNAIFIGFCGMRIEGSKPKSERTYSDRFVVE